ncbi:MAG: ArnT family glycosyltransferase [Geobacteraceae bacterium]
MPIFLFLLTIISRLPLTSKYVYHMDSGHFALALQDYNLVLHQPHPPGYFLYVMLGKLLYPFVSDVNTTFVLISIFFSGLTVVTIYLLGNEIFDARVGTISALLALTSPDFWFHGEIALTYCIEAFFSAVIGLLCWRIHQGKSRYLWLSISILALAGGFRQNSVFFLFPLWLFSVRKESLQRIFSGLALGGLVVLAWLIPMVIMTGGTEKYVAAFGELWRFNTGHNSVFERGFLQLFSFWRILHSFLFYSLGAALPLLLLAFYALIRHGKSAFLKGPKAVFFAFWMLPSVLFYLLVFIHPANPGYVLVLLPPLAIVCSVALLFLGSELLRLTGKDFQQALVLIVLLTNTGIFLLYPLPVSREELRNHDRNIAAIHKGLSTFNPKTTALFIGPYSFYSYRHLMLYLPAFTVYQVDVRISETGEKRNQFGGTNRKTFLTEQIRPSKSIKLFAAVILDDPQDPPKIPRWLSITRITPDIIIVSGPVDRVCDLYPQLRPIWNRAQSLPVGHQQMFNHGIMAPTSKTNDGRG